MSEQLLKDYRYAGHLSGHELQEHLEGNISTEKEKQKSLCSEDNGR